MEKYYHIFTRSPSFHFLHIFLSNFFFFAEVFLCLWVDFMVKFFFFQKKIQFFIRIIFQKFEKKIFLKDEKKFVLKI